MFVHNVRLEYRALDRKLTLLESGVFIGQRATELFSVLKKEALQIYELSYD